MGPLVSVTSQSIQIARMSEPGRFVSSDALDAERRRMMAQRAAFGMLHRGSGGGKAGSAVPFDDQSHINRAFSEGAIIPAGDSPAPSGAGISYAPAVSSDSSQDGTSGSLTGSGTAESRYILERGAFEMRVHRGDLTFVPPLVMTVITQYPEIHFEYTGGFMYVPPSADPAALPPEGSGAAFAQGFSRVG